MPIIRAYIILTNTTIPLEVDEVQDTIHHSTSIPQRLDTFSHKSINSSVNYETDIISRIRDGLNHTAGYARLLFLSEDSIKDTTITTTALYADKYDPALSEINDKFTSAKPVDYLVAGTEGLAWVVHLCFILSLRRGRRVFNPRGPIVLRALIFLLIVISVLLLHSHVNNKPNDDVLPNLSLGFSISVVTLLILYTITLIPGPGRLEHTRSSRNIAVSLRSLLHNFYLYIHMCIFSTICVFHTITIPRKYSNC